MVQVRAQRDRFPMTSWVYLILSNGYQVSFLWPCSISDWNSSPRLVLSCPLLHWPYSHPNVQQAHTPPAPARYWNCSKAVKTPSFSHSARPQRVRLKHTPSLTNTHMQHTLYIQPRALTQVGQSCSGSSKQSSSTMELITVSKIKFYLQTHTLTHRNKHCVPHVRMWMSSLACLFGRMILAAIFVSQRDKKKMQQHRNSNVFLWEGNSEVRGQGWEWSEMSLWETGIPKWSA